MPSDGTWIWPPRAPPPRRCRPACRRTRPTPEAGLLGQLADHSAGIAGGDDALRDVARHYAARADDGPRADAHPRQDDGRAAHPDIRADLHRLARLLTPAQLRVHRMRCRID